MRRLLLLVIAVLTLTGTARAWTWVNYPPDNQYVRLTSTNLPIVWIDVDGDGIINVADVTALIGYVLNGDATSIDLEAADCNYDGIWNVADVTALIHYVLNNNW